MAEGDCAKFKQDNASNTTHSLCSFNTHMRAHGDVDDIEYSDQVEVLAGDTCDYTLF